MPPSIRNFCIIAHIDHGKSTLADRFIELTSTVAWRDMREQLLDSMDIERERGITVKLQTVRMNYISKANKKYQFNLVDTPGHVDFSAEVSRSLAACEGVILLVDVTQGVQAQTIANLRLAIKKRMKMVLVLNKIDSPLADIPRVMVQVAGLKGIDSSVYFLVSAKTGEGVPELLEYIATSFPAPEIKVNSPLRGLVFDSHYDPYQGSIIHVRIVDGQVSPGESIKFMSTGFSFEVMGVGVFSPEMTPCEILGPGEVGFISTGIKDTTFVRMGDTLTSTMDSAVEVVETYQEIKPMVFSGLFPDVDQDVKILRNALQKLSLNDASLHIEPEVSNSLGAGFRCGFLGMLHMDIVKERLKREFDVSVITTAPNVIYKAYLKNGKFINVDNPIGFPGEDILKYVDEPYVMGKIYSPERYAGTVMELCSAKRGNFIDLEYVNEGDVVIVYELPLSEIVFGFFDSLKSITHGYASLDYEFSSYKTSDLVRVDIFLDDMIVDAFTFIIHKEKAYARASEIVKKLKYVIPRKLYPVPAQATVEGRVIAREDIPPIRKNALAQGFSGGISQKNKLIRKQRENKKKGNGFSKTEIPQEAFMAILSIG